MTIPVSCQSCAAKLNAPPAAAGKKVKCPKCGAALQIPLLDQEPAADFEVIEEAQTMMLPPLKMPPKPPVKSPPAAVPPPAKAKPKPVELEMDDEDDRPTPKKKSKPALLDDDDEDDRPTPKKKSKPAVALDDDEDFDDEPRPVRKRTSKAKAKAGMNLPLVLGGATLAVAVVCGLVWYFVIREPEYTFVTPLPGPQDSGTIGGKGPTPLGPPGGGGGGNPAPQPGGKAKTPPAGWKTFTGDGFACSVPSAVTMVKQTDVPPPIDPRMPPRQAWTGQGRGATFQVQVLPVSEDVAKNMAMQMEAGLRGQAVNIFVGKTADSDKLVTIDGLEALQFNFTDAPNRVKVVARIVLHGRAILLMTCVGADLVSESDERVKPFFDQFVIGNNFKATAGAGGKQPVAWVRPTPKPAPKGWKNYSSDDFDAWLPEGAPKPVIMDQPGGRGKRHTWTHGVVKIVATTAPFSTADIADYSVDPLANLARGAEKVKSQLESQGLKCEVKPTTLHGLPCQELRTSPTGNLAIAMLITSSGNKAIIWSITAPGDDMKKTQEELLDPLLANFIPK